jgi:hypothetical protein
MDEQSLMTAWCEDHSRLPARQALCPTRARVVALVFFPRGPAMRPEAIVGLQNVTKRGTCDPPGKTRAH